MSTSDDTLFFRAIFENSLEAVLLSSPDGPILAANPAACELFQCSEEKLRQIGRTAIIDQQSPALAALAAERARNGRAQGELTFIRADGSRFPGRISSAEFRARTGDLHTVLIIRDLSSERLALQALEDSRQLLDAIMDSTPDFILAVEPERFTLSWCNEAANRYFQSRGIEIRPGASVNNVFADEDLARYWRDLFERALQDGAFTTEYTSMDGAMVLQLSLNRLQQGDKVVGVSLFGRDITSLNAAQDSALASQIRYQSVVNAMAEGMVMQDAHGTIIAINPAAQRIQGRTLEQMLGRDSHDPVWDAIREDGSPFPGDQHPSMQALASDKPQHGVIMGILTPQWERRWLSINAEPVRERGNPSPVAVVSTFHDITRQKDVEERLRIAATAFEESLDAMLITSANRIILQVNKAFERITGYTAAEALGQTPRLLSSGKHDRAFYDRMWEELQRDGQWQGEVWNRRKNGELYPEWLRISTVRNAEGQTTHYVASIADLTEDKATEQTLRSLAYDDLLTGLPNRRALLEHMEQNHASSNEPVHAAILFVNIDDFKLLNDLRGRRVGDQLLKAATQRMKRCIQSGDLLARVGSDEFVVLITPLPLHRQTATSRIETIAQRLHNQLAQPFMLMGEQYQCKSCIGISLFEERQARPEEMLARAEAAMFQAKNTGRNKIHFYDAAMQAGMLARIEMEKRLQAAIPDQLQLHYQVQVDQAGRPFGAEALIRWQHPELGMVSPGEFIPLAESSGLILPIGRWVLEQACQQIRRWSAHPQARHLVLAVNVSARQFQQDDFVDEVLQALEQTGADPACLKLELTESMLASNLDAITAKMKLLENRGVRFSLDDFGTGFSSLSYLKRLPLAQLKIDRSFIRDIDKDPNDAAIVRTVIALGQHLGLGVIAEGVETPAQRDFLAAHGCHQFQGYLFGKPLPLAEFERQFMAG